MDCISYTIHSYHQMSTDVSLAQLCAERRTLQLTRVAPNRLEIDSPYNKINSTYTKFDYDMRRKAEVLKYASNKSSSQTNSLSKSEKYALIARGTYSDPGLMTAAANCPQDNMIATPSSASGVPAPYMLLYDDDNVPLYNYINPIQTRSSNITPYTA